MSLVSDQTFAHALYLCDDLSADSEPLHPHAESVPVLPSPANTTQVTQTIQSFIDIYKLIDPWRFNHLPRGRAGLSIWAIAQGPTTAKGPLEGSEGISKISGYRFIALPAGGIAL